MGARLKISRRKDMSKRACLYEGTSDIPLTVVLNVYCSVVACLFVARVADYLR